MHDIREAADATHNVVDGFFLKHSTGRCLWSLRFKAESSDEEDGSDEEDDMGGMFEGSRVRRLEDLSEDDFEAGDSEDDEAGGQNEAEIMRRAIQDALDTQVSDWMDSEDPEPGQPLRCILCPKALLLNWKSLKR